MEMQTLVEHRTTHNVSNASLHIFETFEKAEKVHLKFQNPILSSMMEGKKVMHLNDMHSFDFLPGESLILPSDELMTIDFPNAKQNTPTRCLALEISDDLINNTIDILNEKHTREEGEWKYADYNFHFTNDIAFQQILNRLFFLFTENHPSRDIFADYMLRELVIRVLQAESKAVYTEKTLQCSSDNRLAFVIQYIRENLDQNLTIETLSKKAYMSESNFHRVFKNELGCSPIEFINNERIKYAAFLLKDPNIKMKEIYAQCGFNSQSYFIRQFKKHKDLSPKEYQDRLKTEW